MPEPPVIVSLPAPPTTIAWPAPTEITSSPPSLASVEATRSMFVGSLFAPGHSPMPPFSSAPTQLMRPSSPKTKLVLELVVIVSAPVPPITIALPSPTVIESSPPFAAPGYVVCTMPTVIGSVPKRFVSAPAAKIRPLSPRMMFVPEPPRIVSLPAPPTTIARPAPIVIWSSPPSVGSRRADEVDVPRVAVLRRPRSGSPGSARCRPT